MGKSRQKPSLSLPQPSALLTKFAARLFPSAEEQELFIQALLNPRPYPPAIIWCQQPSNSFPFAVTKPESWQPSWVNRLEIGARPGQDPLHQQGAYYVLDFSSVFAATPLLHLELSQAPQLIIDVCAAPGGKSIFAWKALNPQQLVSNEVIGKRIGMLRSNLSRCRISPVAITNLEVAGLGDRYANQGDVVIVDAPCSGQSLLAKGTQVLGCFHPRTISHNAQRQKKIMALASQLVRPGGYLLYSTCTFSLEENEAVLSWLLTHFPEFQSVAIPVLSAFESAWREPQLFDKKYNRSDVLYSYRLFPQSGLGAGAFTALLKKSELNASL